MDDGAGEILARVLYAIFKKRPSLAYMIFVFFILAVIGANFLGAQTPDEHVLPIILFVFVVSVVLGHTIRDIRQKSVQEFQTFEESSFDEETLPDREMVLEQKGPPEEEAYPENVILSGRETPPIRAADQSPKVSGLKLLHSHFLGLSARDFRQVLIIGVVFSSLGYLVTYFVVTKMLFASASQVMSVGAIDEPFIQLICGLPCVILSLFPVVVFLLLGISRVSESYRAVPKLIAAILSFIFGIVIFLPIQFLFVLGAVI